MLGHLSALVPGEGPAQLSGNVMIEVAIASRTAWAPWLARAGPLWTRFPSRWPGHGWEVQQHRKPGRALDQCPDRGTPNSQDQVAFTECAGTARSSASAGRSLMRILGVTKVRPRLAGPFPLGTRNARPPTDTPPTARLSPAHRSAW